MAGQKSEFNFTRDVLERAASEHADHEALRLVGRDDSRASLTYADVAEQVDLTAAGLAAAGIGPGDVVMTLIENRLEWVLAMLGTWKLGAVALPGATQLRAHDIAYRIDEAHVALVLTSERERGEVEQALATAHARPQVIDVDSESLPAGLPSPAHATTIDDPALIVFTSGTSGEPKGVLHTQGYLRGQGVQARHWYDARPGELAWCTAASGWSLSARNAFVAPWLTGAAAMLYDGRFDPEQRISLIRSENVAVVCQAPTEYRMIAKRGAFDGMQAPRLRRLVSAGEPLNPEVMAVFKEATGLDIYDGYGQTETGPLTAMPIDGEVVPGSMGLPLPGLSVEVLDSDGASAAEGELCIDPRTDETFFWSYLGEERWQGRRWHTHDRVRRDERGFLWFEGRTDDVIISAGYRIGPFEVESALVAHPAVAEAAVVAAPDPERGSVVRAVVVLREGHPPGDELARTLQEHVRRTTAPYKYPRVVDFARQLPKTATGKIKRAELRSAAGR